MSRKWADLLPRIRSRPRRCNGLHRFGPRFDPQQARQQPFGLRKDTRCSGETEPTSHTPPGTHGSAIPAQEKGCRDKDPAALWPDLATGRAPLRSGLVEAKRIIALA